MKHDAPQGDAARRDVVAGLLDAYLNEDLPAQTAAQVEAHLEACVECRAVLSAHRALQSRLGEEPVRPAPPRLRRRILEALEEKEAAKQVSAKPASAGAGEEHRAPASSSAPQAVSSVSARGADWAPRAGRRRMGTGWGRVAAWGGWVVAAALALVLLIQQGPFRGEDHIPMIESALAGYVQATRSPLPLQQPVDLGALRAELPFAVEPLRASDARLIGAWRAEIAGERAAALAYRTSGGRVVIQYVVSEALFFKQPDVRARVVEAGRYTARAGPRSVVAFPNAESGSLLVGEGPPDALAPLVL